MLKQREKTEKLIPIFIITCDRLEVLKKSIKSYCDYIKTPFEIVIIDFGSTYEPTIEYLERLEHEGIKVLWEKRIESVQELNNVDNKIQDYFKNHPKSNYIVTDPDIALDCVAGDILDIYSYLLKELPEIDVVGTMLRIDDIPEHYRNKKGVLATYSQTLKSKKINTIQYKDKFINFIYAPIDSTFGMNKAGTRWVRLKEGIRTMPPYSARHLDWYLDLKNPTQDQKHYIENASRDIANWSLR